MAISLRSKYAPACLVVVLTIISLRAHAGISAIQYYDYKNNEESLKELFKSVGADPSAAFKNHLKQAWAPLWGQKLVYILSMGASLIALAIAATPLLRMMKNKWAQRAVPLFYPVCLGFSCKTELSAFIKDKTYVIILSVAATTILLPPAALRWRRGIFYMGAFVSLTAFLLAAFMSRPWHFMRACDKTLDKAEACLITPEEKEYIFNLGEKYGIKRKDYYIGVVGYKNAGSASNLSGKFIVIDRYVGKGGNNGELYAVLLHELGHIKNGDSYWYSFVYGVSTILKFCFNYCMCKLLPDADAEDLFALAVYPVWGFENIITMWVVYLYNGYISHMHELRADRHCAEHGGGDAYIRYFQEDSMVIATYGIYTSNHLFNIFSTHPYNEERIRKLQEAVKAVKANNTPTGGSRR